MNFHITSIFRVITITLMGSVLAQAQYGGGSGTVDDPYQLWTAQDVGKLTKSPVDWGAHFQLMQNIDMSSLGSIPLETTIGYFHNDYDQQAFTGVFDGQDYQISNHHSGVPQLSGFVWLCE